jgi:hypothetical protein
LTSGSENERTNKREEAICGDIERPSPDATAAPGSKAKSEIKTRQTKVAQATYQEGNHQWQVRSEAV